MDDDERKDKKQTSFPFIVIHWRVRFLSYFPFLTLTSSHSLALFPLILNQSNAEDTKFHSLDTTAMFHTKTLSEDKRHNTFPLSVCLFVSLLNV